jgi:hypothetical protein
MRGSFPRAACRDGSPVNVVLRTVERNMSFKYPWGCAEGVEHEVAWECPKYSQKFLGALQSVAQKLEKSKD